MSIGHRSIVKSWFVMILVLCSAAGARAGIVGTYVDAKPAGTAAAWSPSNTTGTFTFTYANDFGDGKWDDRTNASFTLGAAGTTSDVDPNVLEAGSTNGGGIAPNESITSAITTSATVPFDTYKIYVLYWSPISNTYTYNNWSVQAELSGAGYTEYDKSGTGGRTAGTDTGINDGGVPVPTLDLYEAYLGTVTGSSFAVDIFNSTVPGARSWYEGVAYERVPEPASVGLLALGSLALLRRRHPAQAAPLRR